MDILRNQLQKLLSLVNASSQIDKRYSIGARVNIRFELGGSLNNGTNSRVQQATDRAYTIYNDIFGANESIWVLIYEYLESDVFHTSNEYLYEQINPTYFKSFYNKVEKVSEGFFESDVEEFNDTRVYIGKVPVKKLAIKNILNAIANLEMGFDPGINQRIYFFNSQANIGFHMYDDRGCDTWSDSADNLRHLYINRNTWILDYNREEINKHFN